MLARLSDLISVNVHALLDRAEDPERMLAHLLRTLEEGLVSARLHAARAIAAERQLKRELDECRRLARQWHEQARFALAQGLEDLARRALGAKIDHENLISGLEKQHQTARGLSLEVKAALHALEQRLAEARRRQSLLAARLRAAQLRLEVGRCHRTGGVAASFASLEQLERRLEQKEDDLLAQIEVGRPDQELEAELETLERGRRVEEELRNLRREGGGD